MRAKNIFITIIIVVILVSCSKMEPSQRRIDHIYVYHSTEGYTFQKYNIDLKNKAFTILLRTGFLGMDNEVLEESPVVKALDPDSIQTFLNEVKEIGLEDWDETYIDPNIKDGHQWGITISFNDGTKKEITGSNAYPKTWNKLNAALEALTGENILWADATK